MGLFDGYQFSPSAFGQQQGGGLLDLLRSMQQFQGTPDGTPFPGEQAGATPNYGQTSNVQVGDYSMPMFGGPTQPTDVSAQSRQPQQPVPQGMPLQQQPSAPNPFQQDAPSPLMAGLNSFVGNLHNGPIGAIVGGLGGLVTGRRNDPYGTAQDNLKSTYEALVAGGVPAPQAFAAVKSGNADVMKYTLEKYAKQEKFRPATVEERQKAGVTGDTPLFINDFDGKPMFGPAQTNVNVNTEKTGQAELATKGVNAYVEAQAAGRDSQKRIGMYDALEKASNGFTPGATSEMRLTAKRYLKDLGVIAGEDVPDGEIMQMISRQLAVHAQPKGQGAVSNYERELFAKSLPTMTQSPEGLKQAIGIMRKLEQFDLAVAQIYRDSARSNKGLPNYLEVQDKIAALGSPLDDREMRAISSGGAAPAPAASPAAPASALPSGTYNWTPGGGVRPAR